MFTRKLRIEIDVIDGSEFHVREQLLIKLSQLTQMLKEDGTGPFCWSGAANDKIGKMKFTLATPSQWEGHGKEAMVVVNGIYRHFKGKDYIVVAIAHDTVTDQKVVVYRRAVGDYELYVRPYSMFTEDVFINEQIMPRFKFIEYAVSPRED